MNHAHFNMLIERLRACEHVGPDERPEQDTAFNMTQARFNCGSPACVGGHCHDLSLQLDEQPSNAKQDLDFPEDYINTRFDDLEENINTCFDDLEENISTCFDDLEKNINTWSNSLKDSP